MPYDKYLGLSPDELQRQLLIADANRRQQLRDQQLQAAMDEANQASQPTASPAQAVGALGGNVASGYLASQALESALGVDSAALAAGQANGALGAATAANAAESVAPTASLASYAIPLSLIHI